MFLKKILGCIILSYLIFVSPAISQPPEKWNAGKILQGLNKLNTLGSVLYIAAHPDDENTRLLSWLANGQYYQTAYLSLTRGDGGQNLIGKEQGVELGLIRSKELLAARKVDGAKQFFTRAIDFGYSKSPEETFRIWNKEKILADVVWVIRLNRPDVIINRFPHTGEGGHGHHTASALLSIEAFKAAADPTRFPEQLKYVQPWQARRVLFNSFNFRNRPQQEFEGQIKVDVGGYSVLTGESFGEIASESRSQHKSQGFGVARSRGVQYEYFKRVEGDTMINQIFEGIDVSWKRIKESTEIENIINEAIRKFDPAQPSAILSFLFKAYDETAKLNDGYWKHVKQREIKQLIVACSGLWCEANSGTNHAAPSDSVTIIATTISRAASGFVLKRINFEGADTAMTKTLEQNTAFVFERTIKIPAEYSITQPYWLERTTREGYFNVEDQLLIGNSWNKPALTAVFEFDYNGNKFTVTKEVNYKYTDPVKGEVYAPFEIVPPVSLKLSEPVMVFSNKETKTIELTIVSARKNISGTVSLTSSGEWKISPSALTFNLAEPGQQKTYTINVTYTGSESNPSVLQVHAECEGKTYNKETIRIEHDHIPPIVYQKEAGVKLLPVDLKSAVKKIAYLEGAGDDVAQSLRSAGFDVITLTEKMLMSESLNKYEAILTGIRAFNTIDNIEQYHQKLMDYVKDGGALIVQYNTNNFISRVSPLIGPHPFNITRDRVTDESAEVYFLKPDHSLLNFPNKISNKDFEGWVQERGLYFAEVPSKGYETLISWNDSGEKPLEGSVIYTPYGKGTFIYTGISFFRQLPAGVPGAYRLLVNFINSAKHKN